MQLNKMTESDLPGEKQIRNTRRLNIWGEEEERENKKGEQEEGRVDIGRRVRDEEKRQEGRRETDGG